MSKLYAEVDLYLLKWDCSLLLPTFIWRDLFSDYFDFEERHESSSNSSFSVASLSASIWSNFYILFLAMSINLTVNVFINF